MAYCKSFILVAVALLSMSSSLSLEARHLLQTTGQSSTPYALPRRNQIGKLGPRPNMYNLDYAPIPRTPIPGQTPLPMAPIPAYAPHKNGLHPIGKVGPQPNMYYSASYTPNIVGPCPLPYTRPCPIPAP